MDIFLVKKNAVRVSGKLQELGYETMKNSGVIGKYRNGPRVFFGNTEADGAYGYYNKAQNIIVLSEKMLCNDMVTEHMKNVYLHELAHYVDTVINTDSRHDKTFREICEALGVEENYSRAVLKSINEEEKTREKIVKLLALSKSDFEGEASSALNKAKSLMEQYGVAVETGDEEKMFGVSVLLRKRRSTWTDQLSSVVRAITGAYVIFMHDFFGDGNISLNFYGSLEQVEAAMYLWDSLYMTVNEKEAAIRQDVKDAKKPIAFEEKQPDLFDYAEKAEKKRKYANVGRYNADAVKLGIVNGFMSVVSRGLSHALVVASRENREKFKRITDTEIQHHRARRVGADPALYGAGKAAGLKMSMPSGEGSFTRRITAD